MPAKKKQAKKTSKKVVKPTVITPKNRIKQRYEALKLKVSNLLGRRPHRSFRRTRRRDYARSLKLPGYWSFTGFVWQALLKNKKLFLGLVVIYGLLTLVFLGLGSQETYTQLSENLNDTSQGIVEGAWGEVWKAGLLLVTGVNGSINQSPSDAQTVYGVILIIFVWLTAVWLHRALLADQRPKLRDAIYNAAAPAISTFFVGVVLVLQAFPIAIAALGFTAAATSGLLDNGIEAMVFWTFAGLLTALALYWMTSTFIALVVVALPGMYPMRAIRTAGDLVIGRRLRILLRLLWMMFTIIATWGIITIPIILLDAWLADKYTFMQNIPVVPVVVIIMSSVSIVWAASYIYLLYRRIVDDDAAPA